MNYSKEFKDAILRRMLPPNNESISKIASRYIGVRPPCDFYEAHKSEKTADKK